MDNAERSLADAIALAAARLKTAGIDDFRREAASLAAFVLDKDPVFLIAHPEYHFSTDESARYDEAVFRREQREPFHYITGVKEFYSLDFAVAPGVLIPRPETELLVEDAIDILRKASEPSFLEIGVGSGCISVSILHNVETAIAEGVDISSVAVEIAKANAIRHDVADRVNLRLGDVFDGISGKFDLIVSNPPYIPDADLSSLQAEVGIFEPHSALFGGVDGLSIIRRIVDGSPQFLRSRGYLLIEIGFGQGASVKNLFDPSIWSEVKFIRDLQSIDRIVKARLGY